MKTKIKVVGDGYGDVRWDEYEVYRKVWWWPFWSLIGIRGNQKDAEILAGEQGRKP